MLNALEVAEQELEKLLEKERKDAYEHAAITQADNFNTIIQYLAIDEDYPKEPVHDPDDRLPTVYKNIPIEVCVAGKCVTTTLDKIISSTQHHQAEVERRVEAEREKFERAIGMTIMKFGHGREELKYLIEALTPTKTDKQTEV